MNPHMFWNNNYDTAKKVFITTTCENFRAIYFGFAPLLSNPMYQHIPSCISDLWKRNATSEFLLGTRGT